ESAPVAWEYRQWPSGGRSPSGGRETRGQKSWRPSKWAATSGRVSWYRATRCPPSVRNELQGPCGISKVAARCHPLASSSAGAGEPHLQLSLEHGRRAELRPDHELRGLLQELVAGGEVVLAFHRWPAQALDARRVLRLALGSDPLAHRLDLFLRDPRGLQAR